MTTNDELNDKLDIIIEMMKKFDERLIFIEKNYNINFNNKINDVIVKDYGIDDKIIISSLESGQIISDIDLIKRIFFINIDKKNYPMRITSDKKIEYWNNNKWHLNDNYLYKTLLTIIKNAYLSVNNTVNYDYEDKLDQFLKNQDYIAKMNEEKYRELFIKQFKNIFVKDTNLF